MDSGTTNCGVIWIDKAARCGAENVEVVSLTFIVGIISAVALAVYGKWAKKGDNSTALKP